MWKHLKQVWWFLWHPRFLEPYLKLDRILKHPVRPSVQYALEKVLIDPSFHPTKDHAIKRAEALEWVGHAIRENWHGYSGQVPAWEVSFLLEWELGVRKGRL